MFANIYIFYVLIIHAICQKRTNFYSKIIAKSDEEDSSSFYYGETYLLKFVRLKFNDGGKTIDQFRFFKQYINQRKITETFIQETMPAYAIFIQPKRKNAIYYFDKLSKVHTEIAIINFFHIKEEDKLNGRLILYQFSSPCNLCLLSFESELLKHKELKILFLYEKDIKRDNNLFLYQNKNKLIKGELFSSCKTINNLDGFEKCIKKERNKIIGHRQTEIPQIWIKPLL